MTDWPTLLTRYPAHPDAVPERPWWRPVALCDPPRGLAYGPPLVGWVRTDGVTLEQGEDLDAYDREHPLRAPLPACGQVWVWPDTDYEIMLVGRDDWGWAPHLRIGGRQVTGGDAPWPPPRAVLVAGPGAPWMDTSEAKA